MEEEKKQEEETAPTLELEGGDFQFDGGPKEEEEKNWGRLIPLDSSLSLFTMNSSLERVVVGRLSSSDIVLTDLRTSGRHCVFHYRLHGFFIFFYFIFILIFESLNLFFVFFFYYYFEKLK